MTEHDIARNAKAVLNLAARLEAWGLDDAYKRAEFIATNLVLDGYAPIEPPLPPPRAAAELGGPGHREFQEAKEALANRQKEAH